jgi:hypothetical protein
VPGGSVFVDNRLGRIVQCRRIMAKWQHDTKLRLEVLTRRDAAT